MKEVHSPSIGQTREHEDQSLYADITQSNTGVKSRWSGQTTGCGIRCWRGIFPV